MANSRSNIYPIQLQNAELNLNKYDAEIKQYSGFNKNNAPFVGGCLSNIFTKEQQVQGGNADNVYIDSVGNVFKVDSDGLYKNDNKIIDYSANTNVRPNGVHFFKKRKLNIKDVVKAISETVYITIESQIPCPADPGIWESSPYVSSGYVAHWGNGNSAFICDVVNDGVLILDIAYKDGKIAFTAKKNFNAGANFQSTLNYLIYVPDENESYYKEFSNRTMGGRSEYDPCFNGDSTSCCLPIEVPQVVHFDENGLFWAQNMIFYSRVIYIDYETESDVSAYSFTTTDTDIFNTDFNSWFMTQDGIIHFYYFGIENDGNQAVPLDPSNVHPKEYLCSFTGYKSFAYCMKLSYENGNFTAERIYLAPNQFEFSVKNTASQPDVTFQGWIGDTENLDKDIVTGFFKPYGCQYFSKIKNKAGGTKHIYLSYCQDRLNYGIYINSDKTELSIPGGGQIFLEPFKILINNNQLSNLSIYCSSNVKSVRDLQSLQGNTVEDWNTIKDITYIDNEKCVYVTYNDEYFVIEKTTPKLELKYNQLVVNCNYELNAYDLIQNKVTHFAPDWNNSYIKYGSSAPNFTNCYNLLDFNIKVASAINEYDLKDNPSIILNDIEICTFDSITTNFFLDYTRTLKSYIYISLLKDNAVNFYCNYVHYSYLAESVYRFSGSIFYTENLDLVGLPFPNNKDGNIQYAPNIFSEFIYNFGIDVFVKNGNNVYQLMKEGQENVMAFFLGTLIEGLEKVFIIQGQYYGIFEGKIFSIQYANGVISDTSFIVNVQNLQYVGNTPYEALFYSKTNRCIYSFVGANVLQQKQLVDKISIVRNYLYNPATQTVFLLTDIGVLFYGLFGMYLLEYQNIVNIFIMDNGIALSDNLGNYRYVKYYLDDGDEDFIKENIKLETCFYGMDNQTVTINDCLYMRLFSEEHEEGELKVSATTLSLKGRKTEETTFKIKAGDWDEMTHTIYLRYQPKEQRGLGISFAIESPFKIASMSVGSQADAILVDKVSKGAINAPFNNTSSTIEW